MFRSLITSHNLHIKGEKMTSVAITFNYFTLKIFLFIDG